MAAQLFLPFTPAGKATELRAHQVKRLLGVSLNAPVDPYEVLPLVPARLLPVSFLADCTEETQRTLLTDRRDDWSAVCYGRIGASGEALILLNPTQHSNRQRASLMEEVVHVMLDHPKTELRLGVDAWVRPYDSAVEDEAYAVGAACIIPYGRLFELVHRQHQAPQVIASAFGVSQQYVEYRVKRAGLYRIMRKYSA